MYSIYSRENFEVIERNKQVDLMQAGDEDYKPCFAAAKNGAVTVDLPGGGSVTLSVLPQVEGVGKEDSLELLKVGKDDECAAMVRKPDNANNANNANNGKEKGGGEPEGEGGGAPEELRTSFQCAFEDACRGGLICDEPLHGVVVVLERWTAGGGGGGTAGGTAGGTEEEGEEEAAPAAAAAAVGGAFGPAIVGALAKGICAAAVTRPSRLVEPYVTCDVQTTLASLGAVYAVLSKRRGRAVKEESVEGTDLVAIQCQVPVEEMRGMGGEMLERSGGGAIGTGTRFSHWEVIDADPFWRPTSEEEREEFGEGKKRGDASVGGGRGDLWGRVLKTRKRKGMGTEILVVAADKQRNLSRNK